MASQQANPDQPNQITLEEYYKMLQNHDWHYYMSDDYTRYHSARVVETRIKNIADALLGDYLELFAQYHRWVLSETPRADEPTPEFVRNLNKRRPTDGTS